MNTIVTYNYETKEYSITPLISSTNALDQMEDILYKLLKIYYGQVGNIYDYIKPAGYLITFEDWNNLKRVYFEKSKKCRLRFTLKHVVKNTGLLYNTYSCKKLFTLFMINAGDHESPRESPFVNFDVEERKQYIRAIHYNNMCIDELDKLFDFINVEALENNIKCEDIKNAISLRLTEEE